jgi:FKBP-type peptidyl-prolyl cis-trans isomerase 2
MHIAKVGDRVRIQYTRIGKSGVDRSLGAPRALEFTVGDKHVLPGLSSRVEGMHPGEQKCITLEPAEAFGNVQAKLIREIPRDRLNTKSRLEVGMVLNARSHDPERKRRVRIVEIKPDSILIDGNHPQAGKSIDLAVNLISIDS